MLRNKEDDLIYIENILQKKVLGATNYDEVILEDFEEDKAEQLWKKGEPNADGYFTLENSKVPKVMTAISPDSLEIKGNIFLRYTSTFILRVIVDYSLWFFIYRTQKLGMDSKTKVFKICNNPEDCQKHCAMLVSGKSS